jgi:FkbM family methyltransferase
MFTELVDMRAVGDARRFARARNVSAWSYPAAHRSHLSMLPSWVDPLDGLMLDIGANEGNWTAEVLEVFPSARVLAAEPGPEPGRILTERFAEVPNVTVDLRAIGDRSGSQTYYATRASVFASLLPPEPQLHELYDLPGVPTEVLETIEVPTITLDELVGSERVSVVKLDVQGGELAVLRGARRVMQRAQAILVEVVFVPHYAGDATFAALHGALADLGLALIDLTRPFRLGEGPALWADACYVRARSSRTA